MNLINQRSIKHLLNSLLLGFLISTLIACYEELDLESLCHPLSSNCAEKDFDGDGVINRLDDFPIDPSCSKNDHQNCGRCGNAFCNIDQECEPIKAEFCNGRDDDGNQLVDDNKALAKKQVGVCQGSLRICVNGKEEDADYQKISDYEEVEGLCDGLDNDCDGTIDENLRDIPLTSKQHGVCEGVLKVCQGRMGYLDQYDQISGYLMEDTSCDGLDNDCDGKLDESVDLMLLEKQLGICEGLREVCALAEGIVIDYEQSNDYQEVENHCDGLDNDCDGVVDEELIDIPLTTNQTGVCMNALKFCDGGNGFVDRYQLLAEYQEIEGKCDGLDNDCDGVVDEELIDIPLTTNQIGVCMNALKSCDGENGFVDQYRFISNYESLEGSCDHLDNDCDGRIDEGILGCCGNGTIDDGEECDDNNVSNTDECLMICQNASCGDGFIQEDIEQCDDGNSVNTDSCTNTCNLARCGDGFVQTGEACDDGNSLNTDGCTNACNLARCGDGFIQASERCDDGVNNSQLPNANCRTNCLLKRCGDAILDMEEGCDDGNLVNADSCTNTCNLARCGDGFVQAGETCDDGNLVNTDSCTNTCNLAQCGDGFVRFGSEQCDDGNRNNGDNCSNSCFITCGANCPAMEMILIQAGSFNMGSNDSGAQPVHSVQIRNDFYVGKTEVTVGQYRACVNAGVCTRTIVEWYCNWTSSVEAKERYPLNCVYWEDARKFARWVGGDLPSEAQWEYTARSMGRNVEYPWGGAFPTCQLANTNFYNALYSETIYCVPLLEGGYTAPVCSTIGGNTAQGVCDMGGNVEEWVLDDWHASYNGAPTNEEAWCNDLGGCSTNSNYRVVRGGSYDSYYLGLRSTSRGFGYGRTGYTGFRVFKSVP